MPNKIRPKCQTCDRSMKPIYCKGKRGEAFARIPDAFVCRQRSHTFLAADRDNPEYLAV